MKNKKNMKECIKQETQIHTPDVWDKIQRQAVHVNAAAPKKARQPIRYVALTAACAAVVLIAVMICPGLLPRKYSSIALTQRPLPAATKANSADHNNLNKNKNDLQPAATGLVPSSINGKDGYYGNSEEYNNITDNKFISPVDQPLSTFSIDVDTAAYSNIRRMLKSGQQVPADAVRIEELINYFKYDYPKPSGDDPFSIYTELADCPWNSQNKLLLVGLQGKEVDMTTVPDSNLVFLLDVSGSMQSSDKLPLVKKALLMLVENLRENDRISIVTYASSDRVVLRGGFGANKKEITDAINSLEAGGSTAGAKGIQTAYEIAKEYFIEGGNNRVILATDGDFNVGVSSETELKSLIEEERSSGVYLSVLGFGTGNIKDNKMETLSQYGNGNYAYIDSEIEAKKVLVEQMGGTLLTIAKDVKLQLEFYTGKVDKYRLIGYENRILNSEDFNDDKKDAGEMGAGHRVTAIYEIVPQKETASADWVKVNIRYKNPNADESKLLTITVDDSKYTQVMSENFAFASAVAEFGLVLRNSEYKGNSSYTDAYTRIMDLSSVQTDSYKAEFKEMLGSLMND